jgi:hypothetical protein
VGSAEHRDAADPSTRPRVTGGRAVPAILAAAATLIALALDRARAALASLVATVALVIGHCAFPLVTNPGPNLLSLIPTTGRGLHYFSGGRPSGPHWPS